MSRLACRHVFARLAALLLLALSLGCRPAPPAIEGYGAYQLGAKSSDYNLAAFQKVGAGTTTLYIEDGTQFEWLEDAPKCSLQLSFETNRLKSIALQFRQLNKAAAAALFKQLKQELGTRYPAPLMPTSKDNPDGDRALKLEAADGFIGLYMTVPREKAVPDPYAPAFYHVRLLMQGK